MSNSLFLNNPLTINQSTDVYGASQNGGDFDYTITVNTQSFTNNNLTGLFANATYTQNNLDMNQVNINLSMHNHTFLNWNTNINNQAILTIGSGLSSTGFGTFLNTPQQFGDLLLEVVAHKMFGHAQAHAAIRNDNDFYNHDGQLWNHLDTTLNINNIKNAVFNQYISAGRYSNNDDITNFIPFNFSGMTLDFPLFLNGSIVLDASLSNAERDNLLEGPIVGGSQLIAGNYNVPILVRFI